MSFQRALSILRDLNSSHRVINRDLTNFTTLMKLLGNPQEQFKKIHITGTNGKGSVTLKTASVLANAGFKAGMYTSPHLFTFRERIQINEQMIDRDTVAEYIVSINKLVQKQSLNISYFEMLTSAAFLYFKDQNCDYVSVEVGLGARHDSTNLIVPDVTVISSIGLDHMQLLGSTLEAIAYQKAGIIKEKVPVVLGSTAQIPIIEEEAKKKNAPIHQISKLGNFEEENQAISKKVIEILQKQHPELGNISQSQMLDGLQKNQPCRMQELPQRLLPNWAKEKRVFFDVGHNPAALDRVRELIASTKMEKSQIAVVFGCTKGKNVAGMLSIIEQFAGCIYLVQGGHPRINPLSVLEGQVGFTRHPSKFRVIGEGNNIQKTLQYVTADPSNKTIIISGSFFIMPEARIYFDPSIEQLVRYENINQMYQMTQKNS